MNSNKTHTQKELFRMNSPDSEDQNCSAHGEEFNPEEMLKAKEVFRALEKSFSAMKVFPSGNPSIKSFVRSFTEKIHEFLDKFEVLLIGVDEFKFTLRGEAVFQDEEKKSSLPFLFFKDGIRELSFHKGLDEREIQEFLEVIREESDLPPENSDIVNSLWIKDFLHIRFFAPDEFLESNSDDEENEIDIDALKEQFSNGKIELTSEDSEEVNRRSIALGFKIIKAKQENSQANLEEVMIPFPLSVLKEDETPKVYSLLEECRSALPLTELANLLFEILFLEERQDQFGAILNVLDQCFKEVLFNANFDLACLILDRGQELKDVFSGKCDERVKSLEDLSQKAKNKDSFDFLKKLFLEGKVKNFDSFLQYLKHLGPGTIPLVGDIWEISNDPLVRLKASNFLFEMGSKDIASLVSIAINSRVSLTREVISILGRTGKQEAKPYLERFVNHQDKGVRFETIQALRKVGGESTNRVLLKFLSDDEEDIRVLASLGLKYFGDKDTLEHVLELAKRKDFLSRSRIERKALLNFLALSQSNDVCTFLRSLMKKRRLFSNGKLIETRLYAVQSLEIMASPEALETLKEGMKVWNKTIRQACKLALRRLAPRDPSREILSEV
jgi:HEAT repeat protein